jgi:hypothetical protein
MRTGIRPEEDKRTRTRGVFMNRIKDKKERRVKDISQHVQTRRLSYIRPESVIMPPTGEPGQHPEICRRFFCPAFFFGGDPVLPLPPPSRD